MGGVVDLMYNQTYRDAVAAMIAEAETFLKGEPGQGWTHGWILDPPAPVRPAPVYAVPGHVVPNSVQVMIESWEGADSVLVDTIAKVCRVDVDTAMMWVRVARS
jgi:hypothetical protein